MNTSAEFIEAVAVTAELCGRVFTPAAARVFVEDLSGYPEAQVLGALRRCRREVRGMLTVQDVLSRLDDGRPGADEAWSALPFDEAQSTVWTDEIAAAFAVAAPLLEVGDKVGARFAFKEAYARLVSDARDKRSPVNWWPSLGHDPNGRAAVLNQAADAGRLTFDQVQELLPPPSTRLPQLDALAQTLRIE